jgi:hypothetical protein
MSRTGIVSAVALALVASVGASACTTESASPVASSSVVPADIPACDEVYQAGTVIEDATFGVACVRDDVLLSPVAVRLECTDGRQFRYNDLAWGYIGEGMTLTPEDDPSKTPEAAVDECIAPAPGAPPADS